MTRYADPRRCPDCGAAITPGAPSCDTCALRLTGPTAQQLFQTLTRADDLLATLRAASVPSATLSPASAAGLPASPTTSFPLRSPAVPRRRHGGLSAASVPRLLLGLGAGCLLVAALVFLAVTWSVMGVGGRTATLVAFTAIAGGLSGWMLRRGLRAAAEALALVGYGLLALDVVGADHAGWFGELSAAGLLVLVGVVLAAAGGAAAFAVRRAASALTTAEVVVVAGTALAASGLAVGDWMPVSVSLLVATLAGGAACAATYRLRMRVACVGTALVTAVAWLSLTGQALDRVFGHASWRALWLELEAWPLLVAAALVAAVALLRRLPAPARVAAAGVGELLVAIAVVAPLLDGDATTVTVALLAVLVVVGAATHWLPRPWGLSGAATQALAGVAVSVQVLLLGSRAVERLLVATDPVWSGRFAGSLPAESHAGLPAPWLLPLSVAVLLGTVWLLAEASTTVDGVVAPLADLRLVAALLAASVVGALALYPVAVWLVLGALLLVAAAFAAWWLADRAPLPLGLGAAFLAGALTISLYDAGLTAVALAAILLATGLVHLRGRDAGLAAVAGALLTAALAGSVWTWGHLLDADAVWVTLTGLLVLGGLVLAAPYAPGRWWADADPAFARTGLEVGAAASALPLGAIGVLLAPVGSEATWAAVYLTVAGAVVTVMSLLREDRRALGWAGGVLLALASWVRLWDLGVRAPEAYTLPSAAALLVVGFVHLRRSPAATTMTALAPGLSLALVPSLLWALADPTGPRVLLLGLACFGLVMAGVKLGWTAPLVLGTTVGALLVLRLAAPYIGDAVPRWVLIGVAGALLIGVGASWERRLADARHLMTYVRALR